MTGNNTGYASDIMKFFLVVFETKKLFCMQTQNSFFICSLRYR